MIVSVIPNKLNNSTTSRPPYRGEILTSYATLQATDIDAVLSCVAELVHESHQSTSVQLVFSSMVFAPWIFFFMASASC